MEHRHDLDRARTQPRMGDVYMVQFDGAGSVQRGFRPAVVFSNNKGNLFSPNVVVLPLTTSLKKVNQPTHVILNAESCGLKYDSMVLCENPQSVSKTALNAFITHLGDEPMARIAEAHLIASSALAYLDIRKLMTTWEASVRMKVS